jgi:protein-S-isoprenylcysteine O-methyltransferase Ste14
MLRSNVDIAPSSRTLRRFSAIGSFVFLFLAAWRGSGFEKPALAVACAGAALVIGLLVYLMPQLLRPVFLCWTTMTLSVGWLVSHIILGVIFFGLFTPLAILFRFTRRDVFLRKRPRNASSFWLEKRVPDDLRRYFRQY